MKLELTFGLERETKGAVRYEEVDAQGLPVHPDKMVVGTLYLRKTTLRDARPRRLRCTIESDSGAISTLRGI